MIAFIKKHEPILFLLAVIAICAPVLVVTHFITLDGPAHLYNSHIIYQLLFGDSSAVSNFFTFNNFPNPNYFYHIIGVILYLFFDAVWVEKIIALLYVFLLTYGFRKLVLANGVNVYNSYLIIPFVYAFTFTIGFYNFSFAIAFLVWFVFLLEKQKDIKPLKSLLLISLLYSVLYFSHLMVFILAICIALARIIIDLLNTKKIDLKNTFLIIFPSIPFIYLAFLFITSHSSSDHFEFIPFIELKNWVIDARQFIGLEYDTEYIYTRAINFCFFSLLVLNLFFRIKNKKQVKLLSMQNLFLILALIFLILLFVLPNNLASGGILSVRILLFSNFFLIIYFAYSKQKSTISQVFFMFLLVLFSFVLIGKKTNSSYELDKDFKQYTQIIKYIKNESVVLTIDYSNNWFNSNYGCYLGAIKNCAVLDNYEVSTVHFPLVWKDNTLIPNGYMPDYGISYNPRLNINDYEIKSNVKIDYVVRWKYTVADKTNENNRFTDSILTKHFVKIFESSEKKAELFKHKN